MIGLMRTETPTKISNLKISELFEIQEEKDRINTETKDFQQKETLFDIEENKEKIKQEINEWHKEDIDIKEQKSPERNLSIIQKSPERPMSISPDKNKRSNRKKNSSKIVP